MKYHNIDTIIKTCENHILTTNTGGTEIESVITKYLLIYICGVYEIEIKKMLVERAARAKDQEITSFITNVTKTFRNLKIRDIKGILKYFSDSYKQTFASKIDNTEAEARYSNIVQNRHSIAHGIDINITLLELVESYNKADAVLDAIKEALGI